MNKKQYNNIKKSLKEYQPKNKQSDFLKYLISKMLDNETNSVINKTYTYLRQFDITDEKILKDKLEEYDIRQEYKSLLNFNISKFKSELILNNINFTDFNNILLKNKVGDFLDFLKIDMTIEKYIDCWFKIIIISNIKKLIKKQDNIIKEVIEDMTNYSTEYPVSENTILMFNEYLNENLKN